MAQRVIFCEAAIGVDLLQQQPLAGYIADGYEVAQVSGFSARDNKLMCVVLLSEPAELAEQTDNNDAEQQGEGGSGSYNDNEGGGEQQGETEP